MTTTRSAQYRELVRQSHGRGDRNALAGWKPVVQQCRRYVAIIESGSHLGPGLLVSSDGLVVTNAHVLDGHRSLTVSLFDSTRVNGAPVYRDEELDLAVVKAALHTTEFFDLTDRLARVYESGDEVLAIGHPQGLTFTATRGIISESSRAIGHGVYLQTDVAINPGNSGGPLLDGTGCLVGINTIAMTDSQGLGFAIPGSEVLGFLTDFLGRASRERALAKATDQAFHGAHHVLSPTELVHAAAELTGMTLLSQDDYLWATTPSGYRFLIAIDDSLFLLSYYLGKYHGTDSWLPLQMLRWQEKLMNVRFIVGTNDVGSLSYARDFEDLDVSEAALSLREMSVAVDSYAPQMEGYLDD